MPIHVLAPNLVSKIAAGEVIERPASVVKELVENSLDAGATQVSIDVRGSGVNSIRVSDNGTGISVDEVEAAFQRHATSKISSLADLENTTSLGFRGEALPSIAHVARVELTTRTGGEVSGTFVCLQEGKVIERSARAHPEGTTLAVRNLFRNVPARLKFLKSSTTENGQITTLVSHYSIAFPEVRFTLVIDGRRVLNTPGTGNLRDVMAEVYGLQTAQALLKIEKAGREGGTSPVVSGCVSPPSLSRANRNYISFFVNRRWIQSRSLTRAVERAYEGFIGVGRYPIAMVCLSLPPQSIDANVHPTKREVRFSQEPIIFNTVYGAVRRTLMEKMPIPEVSLSTQPTTTIGAPSGQSPQQQWWDLPAEEGGSPYVSPPAVLQSPTSSGLPILRVLGQVATTYIIAEGPDGLYLIDQHAAHERVQFEKVLAQQAQQGVEVQSLLEPLTVELSPRQEQMLDSRMEILARFGFGIESFGERTYLLRSVPAVLVGGSIEDALKEALDSLEEEGDPGGRYEKLAASLACHSAVRAGQVLTPDEMHQLIRDLERTKSPRTCPHGRPTMIHLSSGRLEKEFGRS